jgi:hypothetical protein
VRGPRGAGGLTIRQPERTSLELVPGTGTGLDCSDFQHFLPTKQTLAPQPLQHAHHPTYDIKRYHLITLESKPVDFRFAAG